MGAVFRRSKKKKVVPPTKPSYTKQNFSSFNDDSKQNDSKNSHSKRAKKIEPYSKIIPIRETINDILLTNEIKEKEETPKKNENLEENFSNISSIQETNHHLQNNTQPQFTKEKSIEKIDNDFVEGNNEQEEKNPKFFQVFSKDSEWANINIANKLKQFNWPMKGFVEIKTLCFEIEYDYLVKGFKILRNNENMNSSILSWVKIEAEQYFSFDLKDINSFNLKTGQAQQNKKMNEGLKFGVDLKGSYLGLDYDQNQDMDPTIISYLDAEIENLWNGLVGNWVSLNFHENSDKLHGKNLYFGSETVSISKELSLDSDQMADFLVNKFKESDGLRSLMKSPYLIPNNLKKWQEMENTNEKFDIHRLNFFMIEKSSNYSGLVELNSTRPFLINIEKTKKIVFEYNGDLYADISQSFKMMLVLWKDVEEIHKEEYILSEASNFQDLCLHNLKQLLIELSVIPTLPLNYRPKPVLQEEFELKDEE